MRVVPSRMTRAWYDQAKIGDKRPVVRATIQKAHLQKFDYDTAWATGGTFEHDRHRRGQFTTIIFGSNAAPREIRNIKRYSWSRSLDQDVATCQITLLNTDMVPIGNLDEDDVDGFRSRSSDDFFDKPGHFTYNRGESRLSENRWGHDRETGWRDVFVPDRVVKTYEGYSGDDIDDNGVRYTSSDDDQGPEHDPRLVQSGTWLIDRVTYNAEGDIVLEMRDVGRLLLDQIVFPPVVPHEEYPLTWSEVQNAMVPHRSAEGGRWTDRLRGKASSSNEFYVGKGLTNPPFKHYVGPNGVFNGHHPNHVLENDRARDVRGSPAPDAGTQNRWVSTGQTTKNSVVWWQVDLNDPANVAAVRIHPSAGPYRIYISLKGPDGWYGKRKIPYEVTTADVNVHAGIPFVQTAIADRTLPFDVILKRRYPDVRAVRITLTHLWDAKIGLYPWRAGLKDIRLYVADRVRDLKFKKDEKLKVVGNYWDYTNIIKWACAWGGWYWPPHGTGKNYIRTRTDKDVREYFRYANADNVLPKGRVWGDFMKSGTAGKEDLSVDLFDKKPLMDMINYVRDILGFIFFIDETGAVIWRIPNNALHLLEPRLGNWLTPRKFGDYVANPRTDNIITLDEKETLLEYSTDLSSEQLRERIFVANSLGKIGTVIHGPVQHPVGFRRTAGWTDQRFKTKAEVRVMADMIAARQLFEFRRAKAKIPGYPAIQVDDIVRIVERVTNETYYHYVMGINCELDMQSGEYTYDLDTHWLGERPRDVWAITHDQMDAVTKAYLQNLRNPEKI